MRKVSSGQAHLCAHSSTPAGRGPVSSNPRPVSALFDLVTLRGPEALVGRWGKRLADVWRELGVARAHGPGVGHAGRGQSPSSGHHTAATQEEDGHLHARAADLHFWLLGIADHEVSEGAALVERSRAHVQTKHWLTLYVHHLVDVELGALLEAEGGSCTQEKRYRERKLPNHCERMIQVEAPRLAAGAG